MKLNYFDFTPTEAWVWVKANWKPNKTQIKYFILLQVSLTLVGLTLYYLEGDNTKDSWIIKNAPKSSIFWLAYELVKEFLPYTLIVFFTWKYFTSSKGTFSEALQWGLLNTILRIATVILALPAAILFVIILRVEWPLVIIMFLPLQAYGVLGETLTFSGLFLLFKLRWHTKIIKPYLLFVASFAFARIASAALLYAQNKTITNLVYQGLHLNLGVYNIPHVLSKPLVYIFMIPAYIIVSEKIKLPSSDKKILYFFGSLSALFLLSSTLSASLHAVINLVTPSIYPITPGMSILFGLEEAFAVTLGAWFVGKYAKEELTQKL